MIYWWRYYIWEGISMRESTLIIAFILLIIGTIGLLLNELIFDWGRCATLTFAIINVVGLASLAFAYWANKKTP
jgi:multisubunit Na+/H+ antiporter MnhB subunit